MTLYFFQLLQARNKARITTLLLLISTLPGVAAATVYQCRTQDEILFLTNNRNKFPQGCHEIGDPIGDESAALAPGTVSAVTPGRDSEINDRRRPAPRSSSQPPKVPPEAASSEDSEQTAETQTSQAIILAHKKELDLWSGLAQKMAAHYQAIQNSTVSASEKAEKLEKLENNLRMLRDGLASSQISKEERAEIETKLPPM